MQTKITITNSSQTCYIDIEGTIGVEHTDPGTSTSVATYEAFRREVERIAEVAAQRVVVNIRSTGGDVQDALLIYDALRALDAHVTTRCYGYTASAATIIAQAADEGAREISSNAMYLIHRSMCAIEGNAQSLLSRAELLRKTDERLAQLYALHSKRDVEEMTSLMAENNGEGRWLTAEEAVAAGLADRIIDSAPTLVEQSEQEKMLSGERVTPSAEAAPAIKPSVAVTPEPEPTAEDALAAEAAPAAAPAIPQEVKQAAQRAAGELLRYLLTRLAYRWEQWMENLRERRAERQLKREAEREAKREKEEGVESAEEAAQDTLEKEPIPLPTSADEPAADAVPTSSPQVQAVAQRDAAQQMRRSMVAFDSGQRRYAATSLKQVDDPSLQQPYVGSNTQAYTDDAKAFSR